MNKINGGGLEPPIFAPYKSLTLFFIFRAGYDPVYRQFPVLRREDPYFQQFSVSLTPGPYIPYKEYIQNLTKPERHGFLQIYNSTMNELVPSCDRYVWKSLLSGSFRESSDFLEFLNVFL